jgi:hypothetical protein
MDIMAFQLADGRQVTIRGGWRGSQAEQEFLREVFLGACRHFNTVLGPGSDMFHYDHFHIDLARHDPAGRRRVCRPVIKFTPRLGDGALAQGSVPAQPAMTWRGAASQTQRPPSPNRARPDEADITLSESEAWEDDEAPPPTRSTPPRPALATPAAPPLPAWRPPAGPERSIPPSPPASRPGAAFLPPADVGTGRIY